MMSSYTVLNSQFTIIKDPQSGKCLAKCCYCEATLKYHHSTTSLTYHLRSKHSIVGKRSVEEVKAHLQSTQKKPELPNQELCAQITRWIALDLRPTDIVQDVGLKHVLQTASGQSNFVMPSEANVLGNLHNLYQKTRMEVGEGLTQTSYLALTVDDWSADGDTIVSVRCHYVSSAWEYCTALLGAEYACAKSSRVTIDIGQVLSGVTRNWDLTKYCELFHLVIDQSCDMCGHKNLTIEQTPCLAKLLHACIGNVLAEYPLDEQMECQVLRCYNELEPESVDPNVVIQLAKLPLTQGADNSWRSIYTIIGCLLGRRKDLGNQVSDDDWVELSNLHQLFTPFETAISIFGGSQYVSASSVLPFLAHLRQQMVSAEGDSAYIQQFKAAFLNELNNRVTMVMESDDLQLATVLDIRYKRLLSLPKEKRSDVWEKLKNAVKGLAEPTEHSVANKRSRTSILSLAGDDEEVEASNGAVDEFYLAEYEIYRLAPQVVDDEQCPLQWWRDNSHSYPLLSQLAKKYLAVPATSLPCEQLFSTGRRLWSKKTSSLSPENVEQFLCLSDWLSRQQV